MDAEGLTRGLLKHQCDTNLTNGLQELADVNTLDPVPPGFKDMKHYMYY